MKRFLRQALASAFTTHKVLLVVCDRDPAVPHFPVALVPVLLSTSTTSQRQWLSPLNQMLSKCKFGDVAVSVSPIIWLVFLQSGPSCTLGLILLSASLISSTIPAALRSSIQLDALRRPLCPDLYEACPSKPHSTHTGSDVYGYNFPTDRRSVKFISWSLTLLGGSIMST